MKSPRISTFCYALAFLLFFFTISCQNPPQKEVGNHEFVSPEFWKKQVLEDVLPYWTESIIDSVNGSFYTTLDERWRAGLDAGEGLFAERK